MAAFIIYAIRWAVTLTLFYSFFRLLLRRETYHRLNRAVLLAILVVSPLLPLLPLHTDEPTAMDAMLTRIEEPLMSLSSDANNADATFVAQESEDATPGLWVRYLAYIYIIGIAFALAIYLLRLLTLARLLRRCHNSYERCSSYAGYENQTALQLDALDYHWTYRPETECRTSHHA